MTKSLNLDLSQLDLENPGAWPLPVQFGLIGLVIGLLLTAAFILDTQNQLNTLDQAVQQETKLKADFEIKYHRASNLELYKQQLVEMEKAFGSMLRKLPNRTEVPGLLEDISKTGVNNGLIFTLFKPQPERQLEFYAELPIDIEVWGTYHRFAKFVSDVAALPRIVTLHNFKISRLKEHATPEKDKKDKSQEQEALSMTITAKTYRYAGED